MSIQIPTFYKQNPADSKNKTLVDETGKPVSLEEFKMRTGQSNLPGEQIDWSFVKPGTFQQAKQQQEQATVDASLSKYFTPEQIIQMPQDLKVGLAAFGDVQQKNLESGLAVVDINAETFNKAMQTAANDPEISQRYGEALQTAVANTQTTLQELTGQYTREEAQRQREIINQNKVLSEQEAAAGRAFSGFRQQAKQKLATEQGDVIESSRQQLKQSMRSTLQPFETRYGTEALTQKIGIPQIGTETYKPLGNIKGSEALDKAAAVRSRATEMYNVTQK
jgi:hypothetical protein